MMASLSRGCSVRRRTTRNRVSLLTGIVGDRQRQRPGCHPMLVPSDERWSQGVRSSRDNGANTASPNRSAKNRRRQRTACTRTDGPLPVTRRPEIGRSATFRTYRFWLRREAVPQQGQVAEIAAARTSRNTQSVPISARSTTKPAGPSLVDPNLRSIALIPSRKLRDISLHMQRK